MGACRQDTGGQTGTSSWQGRCPRLYLPLQPTRCSSQRNRMVSSRSSPPSGLRCRRARSRISSSRLPASQPSVTTAHRAGVVESFRHLVDAGVQDQCLGALCLWQRCIAQLEGRRPGRAPCSEMLGGKVGTHSLADVVIDVMGVDWPRPVLPHILKQSLSGKILQGAHDGGKTPITQFHVPLLARLAAEGKAQLRPLDIDMFLPQRGQSETLVVARIGFVADPDHRVVKKQDDACDDSLAHQRALSHVGCQLRPKLGQISSECCQRREFGLVTTHRPLRMIAVLLAPFLVASRRLDM